MGRYDTKFILFKDKGGRWRWHVRAHNGRKVATSGESFASKRNADRAILAFVNDILSGRCRWTSQA